MKKRRFVFGILVFVFAIFFLVFVREAFLITPPKNAVPVEITFSQGSSTRTIANVLHEKGLLRFPIFFRWFVALSHAQNSLQAGTFVVLPNSSLSALVLEFFNPAHVDVQVTIPEGFTNNQIEERFANAFESFDRATWKAQTKDLQGYLFPDTYRFSKTAGVSDVVEKMQSTLDRRLTEAGIDFLDCPKYDLSMGYVSPFRCDKKSALILAALVEKEVQDPEDMKHIAGIFFNRLAIGMPLQSDAYPDSYKKKGLPPYPICNPGMNAILAVLHPDQTKDLYFIAPPNHPPVYAKTLEEQIANQRNYLK